MSHFIWPCPLPSFLILHPMSPLSDAANHDPKAGPVPDAKIFKDSELINMIDPILEADDRNKALYIILLSIDLSFYKSNRISVCVRLFVPKDLTNRWTDLVLLYNVASYRSL